jgi:hypothetical protein
VAERLPQRSTYATADKPSWEDEKTGLQADLGAMVRTNKEPGELVAQRFPVPHGKPIGRAAEYSHLHIFGRFCSGAVNAAQAASQSSVTKRQSAPSEARKAIINRLMRAPRLLV